MFKHSIPPIACAMLLGLGAWHPIAAQPDWARQATDTARQLGVDVPSLEGWPPSLGSSYPDLLLRGIGGEAFNLESLLGQVVLLEFADMRSPESQSLAGANQEGGLAGVEPNANVLSLSEYIEPMLDGVGFGPDAIQRVVVLVADERGAIPNADKLAAWSEQFGLTAENGAVVVAPTQAMASLGLNRLAPGFHLLGPDGDLAATATGAGALGGLRQQIIPTIATMMGIEPEATDRPTFTEQDISAPDPIVPDRMELPDVPRLETEFIIQEVETELNAPPAAPTPTATPTPRPRESLENEARDRLRTFF